MLVLTEMPFIWYSLHGLQFVETVMIGFMLIQKNQEHLVT